MSDRRDICRSSEPVVCYAIENLPPKHGGVALYAAIGTAIASGKATLVHEVIIPAKDARSWKVPAGCLWRIICNEGPQVADMNCWCLDNPKERFFSSKTRQIHATHLSTGDRLWSNMPYLRPLATITGGLILTNETIDLFLDTIAYGFDEDGAGVHDVIGSRCDPYTNYLMTNEDANTCCHSNLTRQALRDGLDEMDVHDVLNVFMCTGFTKDTHQYFCKPSPVDVGDYIEFLAETDLLVSASTCPQGDVSLACGGGGEPVVYSLKVEVWKPEEGWLKQSGWKPSERSGYGGNHGL